LSKVSGTPQHIELHVDSSCHGVRLDKFLSKNISELSRTRLKELIKQGLVLLDDTPCSLPKHKVKAGQSIRVTLPKPTPLEVLPKKMKLEIIFEDEHIVVVNKPAGLVVHPGAGNLDNTLVHGLLHHCTNLSGIGGKIRPGIVHRLDKDTSGVMVVAKNDTAHQTLSQLFKERKVEKTYLALIKGKLSDRQGLLELPIARHPIKRTKMTVDKRRGRWALTRFQVKRDLFGAQLVQIRLLTGRTHQIRVHMSYLGHPLLGDIIYGGPKLLQLENGYKMEFRRQMLHSWKLAMPHPLHQNKKLSFEAPIPQDMAEAIKKLNTA